MIIPSSNIVEFVNPEYTFLKIRPTTSLRNYESDIFIPLVAQLYTDIKDKIQKINNKLHIEHNEKLGYYIYMEKSKVQFFFIVPQKHFNLFKDKIHDAWNNKIDVISVDEIPNFDIQNCTKYYMTYKKADALSLTCDKRSNSLIGSQLNTLHIMEEGDKVGVYYNFFPDFQKSWKAKWDNTINDMKYGYPIYHSRLSGKSIFKYVLNFILNTIDTVLDSISLSNTNSNKPKLMRDLELSHATTQKREKDIVNSQIILLSESVNKEREKSNALSLCHSFECLNGDNELIHKKVDKKFDNKFNLLDTKIKGADFIKIQPRESQNFISMPARELLEEHKVIEYTKVRKELPPKELLNGVIPLGICDGKENEKVMGYMSTEKTQKNLPYAVVGANRTGKSTLLQNIAYFAQQGGECTIFFDFCGNCESSDDINMVCENVLNIDCSDIDRLQGMGYNEVRADDTNVFRHYDNVKGQASQLIALINNTNEADRDLKTKMNKFLRAASLVVFLNNGSFKDVFEVLQDYELRNDYINRIKPEYVQYMSKHIRVLSELDDIKGGEIVGNKYNPAIYGIMDRIDSLQANTYMELMFEKDTQDNFNIIDEMQKAQVICFRMPEVMFKTETEKDIYCTYWMSKIWFALKLRQSYYKDKDLTKVNIIIDELYQVERCEEFVKDILSQMPKFNARMILSCHYIDQLTAVKNELLNANGSYVLIAGCSKQNYTALKEEMYPHTLEDLMGLKKFQALNVIKLGDGYYSFITSLPKPLNPKHVL